MLYFEEHDESLSDKDKAIFLTRLVPDYEKFGTSTRRTGLQYLIHIDRTYHHQHPAANFKRYSKKHTFDGDEIDHVRLYGFDEYVMQATRGLARGASGMHDRHKYIVYCIWSLCRHMMKDAPPVDGLS